MCCLLPVPITSTHVYVDAKCGQAEKQPPWSPPNDDNVPCGPHCYQLVCFISSVLFVASHTPFEEPMNE